MTMCGASGAGKTTMARCLHDTWNGPSILIDLDHEPEFGHVVESVEGLARALADGKQRIAVRPPATVVSDPDLFPQTIEYLMRFGNSLRESSSSEGVQLLMDEAQDLQEKWATVALKRLRKRHIKPVAMTQDPISLSNRLRTVADYNAWLSPPPAKMAENLRPLGYPIDLLNRLEEHDMLVLGEGWEPVDRVRAPEVYAVE